MNWFLIASGLAAAFMLAGHSTIGRRQFFLPMLGASFDPTAKRVMEFVWHMSTAALVLPPFVLLYASQLRRRRRAGTTLCCRLPGVAVRRLGRRAFAGGFDVGLAGRGLQTVSMVAVSRGRRSRLGGDRHGLSMPLPTDTVDKATRLTRRLTAAGFSLDMRRIR